MSTDLNTYLVRIAIEPDRFSEFVADPRAAAEKAGLSPEDQSILMSGDQNQIYAALVKDRQTETD
jgi:hypothetical protein